ncbi:hypothetical protein CASFOL_035168 [Castilleja foliolosa]|uniref:Uncharacterized protein n=1 Tax=Castilleja foliolosa TaxID=1961234 RepID=A0ABD3BRW5_9LAMI
MRNFGKSLTPKNQLLLGQKVDDQSAQKGDTESAQKNEAPDLKPNPKGKKPMLGKNLNKPKLGKQPNPKGKKSVLGKKPNKPRKPRSGSPSVNKPNPGSPNKDAKDVKKPNPIIIDKIHSNLTSWTSLFGLLELRLITSRSPYNL